ncbi:MAG: [FeFe] hydrogenase, group A [Candidatus Muiribacteriota bacterium]
MKKKSLIVDNIEMEIKNEKNLLELIRKANINLPTFCYHSDLSVYGACRLCLVEIQGRGLQAACSIEPQEGMNIKTNTSEIRKIRKNIVELLLANHDYNCTVCKKSTDCQLQALARRVGITDLRFKSTLKKENKDYSSPSIVRDPNRCVLCGDCVRMCFEIQSVGAIDFAHRGSKAKVLPAFGKDLNEGECINCGQCISVCPTGALTINSNVEKAWEFLNDKNKKVVVQLAPAVRVAIGEKFGINPGSSNTGQLVSALKIMGFDKVFDTSYAADLTIMEEVTEFLENFNKDKLPLLTSCCPAWIKFAEQYYPELLKNISTCKSPQQMFGSLLKEKLPEKMNARPEDLIVVSIMPCTAKKFEADRKEFIHNDIKEVDIVLTTQEITQMIMEHGIDFKNLSPESLDMPFGFKTGGGLIFGNTGGVSEAVARYVDEILSGEKKEEYEFNAIRGSEGIRELELGAGDSKIKIAAVHGLKMARKVAEEIKNNKSDYDFIEVMACPGGCVGGAGQPVDFHKKSLNCRTKALYECDKTLQLHKSQTNPYIKNLYAEDLGKPGSPTSHNLLHTSYSPRKRMSDTGISLIESEKKPEFEISVCVGTSCYLKGSQNLIQKLTNYITENSRQERVNLKATFCFEKCDKGPNVKINNKNLEGATFEKIINQIKG